MGLAHSLFYDLVPFFSCLLCRPTGPPFYSSPDLCIIPTIAKAMPVCVRSVRAWRQTVKVTSILIALKYINFNLNFHLLTLKPIKSPVPASIAQIAPGRGMGDGDSGEWCV